MKRNRSNNPVRFVPFHLVQLKSNRVNPVIFRLGQLGYFLFGLFLIYSVKSGSIKQAFRRGQISWIRGLRYSGNTKSGKLLISMYLVYAIAEKYH